MRASRIAAAIALCVGTATYAAQINPPHVTAKPLQPFDFRGRHIGDPEPSTPEPEINELGGVRLLIPLSLKYVDGKFTGLITMFDGLQADNISHLIEDKYGKPKSSKVETRVNMFGVKSLRLYRSWRFKEGTLDLQADLTPTGAGTLSFISSEQLDKENAAARAKAKADAKGAF